MCTWDGRTNAGVLVAEGGYYYILTLSNRCNTLSIQEAGTITVLYNFRSTEKDENDTGRTFKETGMRVYPNPFRTSTVFEYHLTNPQQVSLQLYNSQGKSVVILVNQWQEKGLQQIRLDASSLAPGVYIYQLKLAGYTYQGKVIKLKD